jgi:hypothetical protein
VHPKLRRFVTRRAEESLALFETAKAALNKNRYMIALRGPADVTQICWDTNEASLINAFEKHCMLEDGSIPPLARPRIAGPVRFDYAEDDDWS